MSTYQITGEPKPGGYILPAELAVIEGLPEAPVVLDVGANVGDFTQAVLERREGARVIAFEPQFEAVTHFAARFAGDERVHMVPMAVSNKDGRREFFSADPTSQLGTLYPRRHVPEIKLHSQGDVLTTTIVTAFEELAIDRVDLLKIDAEGSELDVLRGAVPVLDRIDAVLWELILGETAYTQDQPEDFAELLDGFEVKNLSPEDGDNGMFLYVAERVASGT